MGRLATDGFEYGLASPSLREQFRARASSLAPSTVQQGVQKMKFGLSDFGGNILPTFTGFYRLLPA